MVLLRLLPIMLLVALSACGGSGGSQNASDPNAVAYSHTTDNDYEDNTYIWYFQHLIYPAAQPVLIHDKAQAVDCNGRVTFTTGASTFALDNFVAPCDALNGTWAYRLTKTCQGYTQSTYICGNTELVEIVASFSHP